MKIAIVGAGAIGGYLGACLAATGEHQVSALARGATLDALRSHGWRVQEAKDGPRARAGARWQAPLAAASDHAAELGRQDAVVIAVKSQALPGLAPNLQPMIGPETLIVPAMNGVPWWFCQQVPEWQGRTLSAVDPDAGISRALPAEQVLGCVVHMACSSPEPGLVLHRMGQGLIVGEASGSISPRAEGFAACLQRAGLDTTLSPKVRQDIWYKLWGNMTMNPVSALTGATLEQMLQDPLVRQFCTAAMQEASEVGGRIGCPIGQSPEDRHALTQKLGAVKTSMLQDVEAGRSIELDAIVGAVREIAQVLGVPTPHIDILLGLTRLMASNRGLYPQSYPRLESAASSA
jgi:2-dehydropantoate 2-reductase